LVPTESGPATLLPAALMVALCSSGCSGAILLTSAMAEVSPCHPPVARETYMSRAPPPWIIKD
jgi:hypothetical protein